jgi:hypothetical protein
MENVIWVNNYYTYLNKLHLLQIRVIRIITNSDYQSHTEHLFKKEGLLTIYDINTLETAILMYKFNTNQLPRTFNDIFKQNKHVHNYNTRQSHKYHTVLKEQSWVNSQYLSQGRKQIANECNSKK